MRKKQIFGAVLLGLGLALVASAVFLYLPANGVVASDLGQVLERKPRSIVLVTLDTTRADYLQPYGAKNVLTPTLQRLADEGVLMENAFAVAPLTLPAHTAIMTGQYPPQTGVRNNGTHFVSEQVTTLAERLSRHGYQTAAFVSAAVLERRYGLDQGFEVYDDDLSKSRLRAPRMVADRPAEFTVAAASRWLDSIDDGQPFFLWVHLYDPHVAYNPPPPYRDEYRTNLYAGEIAYADAQLGELLAHPKIAQVPDVAVSVIADHGESLGEHGENTHGILPYSATLRVPWILWTDDGPKNLRIAKAVSQVDLVPTLLDMLGLLDVEDTSDLAGQSLLKPIADNRAIYSESYLPFYTYGWSKLQVMRSAGWEYIKAPREELYDLNRDPKELSNLAQRRDGLVHDLQQQLDTFQAQYAPEGDREQSLEVDQVSLEKLRALGYIAMGGVTGPNDGTRADPKDVVNLHTMLERARRLMNQQLYTEAAVILEGLLADDPNNLAAMAELAIALVETDKLEPAMGVLEDALALAPDNEQLLLMLAKVESQRDQAEKGLVLVDRVLELNPTNMGAWQFKSQVQAKLGKRDESIATLEQALRIEPLHPLINTIYAQRVEIVAGLFDKAELRLRQAAARDPFLPYPWRILGGLLERQNRLDEAETAYRQGLKYTPDDPSLHALLAVQLARRGALDAEAHLREAIRNENEFKSELYVSLGAELARKGRLDEAMELYARVLASDPGNVAARNNQAVAMANQGNMDAALEALQRLTSEQPAYADAQNNLAVILLGQRNYIKAEKHARITVKLVPGVAEAWDTLGAALLGQGRTNEAMEPLNRSLELEPDYWSAHLNRGLARMQRGESAAAREDLEAALAAGKGRLADTYLALGQLYDKALENPGRAQRYYRAFLDKFPRDPRAKGVRDRLWQLQLPGKSPDR